MNLASHSHARSTTTVGLVLAVLVGGALQASADPDRTAHGRTAGLSTDVAPAPGMAHGSTLFATWGTVTNGNSSANAAEHRTQLTGAHAGSTNAAEAPAFWARGH